MVSKFERCCNRMACKFRECTSDKEKEGEKRNHLWKEELTHWDLNCIFIKLSKREVKGSFVFHGDEVSCAHTVGQVLC